jgi:hypothetical protein
VSSASTEGSLITDQIMDAVGLKPNFEVIAANVPNAAAVTYAGKRYILYNPNFFAQLTKTTGTKWAAISVLAHEIGHHLDGHTVSQGGSQPALELEADEFSGFVLRKMGASLEEAQIAMRTAAQQRATATHPAQYDRLDAIAKGWNHADDQANGRSTASVSRPAPRIVPSVPTLQPERMEQNAVAARIRFNADPETAYFITSQKNVVKYSHNQVQVIGKLAVLNSNRYPFMIYDNSTQLFVDAHGNIITDSGKLVGTVSAYK